MKWLAYINQRLIQGPIKTTKEVFDIPNTTRVDMAAARLHVVKALKVKEDNVLCIPGCTNGCTETTHTKACQDNCKPSTPTYTR